MIAQKHLHIGKKSGCATFRLLVTRFVPVFHRSSSPLEAQKQKHCAHAMIQGDIFGASKCETRCAPDQVLAARLTDELLGLCAPRVQKVSRVAYDNMDLNRGNTPMGG